MKRIEIKASSFQRWIGSLGLLVANTFLIVLVIDEWSIIELVCAALLSILTLRTLDYNLTSACTENDKALLSSLSQNAKLVIVALLALRCTPA
jgi:hypothetical protein